MLTPEHREEPKDELKPILDLSLEISLYSPAMKPFIRFAKETDRLYDKSATVLHPSLYWDFDDTLQKILLQIARTVATPHELWQSCTERSKDSLRPFIEKKKWELNELVVRKTRPWFETRAREDFVLSRIPRRSRILYIGYDSGIESFLLTERGHHITAIHPDPELVDTANDWARYFRFPFKAICTDLMDISFPSKSFDTFVWDFYGWQPSLEQLITVQRALARATCDDGLGFVVAGRKKFSSFWFLTKTPYSGAMTRWLMKQAPLDLYYSRCDSVEERLLYGVYNKSYTKEALSAELSITFDVLECFFEKYDPRYVMGVVKPKTRTDYAVPHRSPSSLKSNTEFPKPYVWFTSRVQSICDILKSHEQRVSQYFNNRLSFRGKNPLQAVDTDLSEFIDLLTEVFEAVPTQLR
jgi:hypothetical protein